MEETKKAVAVKPAASSRVTHVPVQAVQSAPSSDQSELDSLRGLVSSMRTEVNDLKDRGKKPTGATVRNRTRDHVAFLREYADADGTVVGIVTRLYAVKEVKDKSENKRYAGICVLDVVNPETGDKATVRDVNYLEFLNDARKVKAKIEVWNRETRYETELKRGGGGVGPMKRQTAENETVVENDHEFEVGYVDHTFTLTITEGVFEGKTLQTDELALNI